MSFLHLCAQFPELCLALARAHAQANAVDASVPIDSAIFGSRFRRLGFMVHTTWTWEHRTWTWALKRCVWVGFVHLAAQFQDLCSPLACALAQANADWMLEMMHGKSVCDSLSNMPKRALPEYGRKLSMKDGCALQFRWRNSLTL